VVAFGTGDWRALTASIIMKFVNTFEKHRKEPDKPLEEYTKGLRLQLGETCEISIKK
jgi:hypothetical protein